MNTLPIGRSADGEEVQLPDDAVTQGFALLARRRSGKSSLAGVIEETFCDRGDPWVCLDPVSAHWGIRYFDDHGKPGTPSGYEVLIVGGKYGDVPLDDKDGGALAQIVVETDISCIIDLGGESMNAQHGFVADFAQELLRLNETPRHIIVEEAHSFIPQQLQYDKQKLVHAALSKLITMGGGRGIGYTLITPRPAGIAKAVLEQVDNLVVMRMSGPNDLKAVQGWFEHNVGDKGQLAQILRTLPAFKPGEAWLCSPEWMGELVRMTARIRRTYHAGRTPERGEAPVSPKRVELTAVIERFRAAAGRRQVSVESAEPARTAGKRKAVAAVDDEVERLLRQANERVARAEREREEAIAHASRKAGELQARIGQLEHDTIALDHLRTGLALLGIAGTNGGGGGLSRADVEAIVRDAVARVPQGGQVYVPAPEVLRKKYQQEAVDRVLAKVAALTPEERRALEYLLGQDGEYQSVTKVTQAMTGNTAGPNHKKWGGVLGHLVAVGVAERNSNRTGTRAAARAWVARELSAHNPADAEVDDVHRAVLARLAEGA